MLRLLEWIAAALLSTLPSSATSDEPVALLEGQRLTRLAAEPEIATPIGLAFLPSGDLLVVESHTHKRQADYPGPAGDRIRRFVDSDGDKIPDRWGEDFAGGYRHALNLAVRPDGIVYLVTRDAVRLLRDRDGDGQADEEQVIVQLETEVDYPHNALGGIWLEGDHLFLGMGENFGALYALVGSDGASITDAGGSGRIFTCRLDGSRLSKLASGLWNPFGLCASNGRLFCIDNDPDASPPCRLLEVQPGDDFGYRYEYNRPGLHPLQAWDGELPGTKGMVCGVGEAPTGIVAHRGWLWVTSWGEHRIERYRLRLVDGTLMAERQIAVQGLADFRPTGLAVGPDGALYFGDWVSRSYPVHGQGRLWRLELPDAEHTEPLPAFAPQALRPRVVSRAGLSDLVALRAQPDRGVWSRASAADRLGLLLVARDEGWLKSELLRLAFDDPDADVRLTAVRFAAELQVFELKPDVEALLEKEITEPDYYLALVAAVDWLDAGRNLPSSTSDLMARQLADPQLSPALRTIALRNVSPDHAVLQGELLAGLLRSGHLPLRREAVQTLALSANAERLPRLVEIASNAKEEAGIRATAVAGLSSAAGQYEALLRSLVDDPARPVAREALRVLRVTGHVERPAEQRPSAADLTAWNDRLATGGDAEAGRRLFFMGAGVGCAACHRHSGRGAGVGPDLTRIGSQQARARIVSSILQPSAEIAPRYEPWVLATSDGETHTGLRLPQGGDDGQEAYVDASGRVFKLRADEIENRYASPLSIMPSGMEGALTVDDLKDLLAFLSGDT